MPGKSVTVTTVRYQFRDPVSGFTHLVGAFLGAVGWVLLLMHSSGGALHAVAYSIFGVSLILLYTSSSLYHLLDVSPQAKLVFRQIDHAMIYLLIAGSYTPFCMLALRGRLGYGVLALVWGFAVAGIVISILWIHAPRWLSTTLYLFIGWIAVVAIYPLSQVLSSSGLYWLIGGGLFYTAGAVIYALKWPDPFPSTFGFHEIWHLFVLAGSASHFVSVSTIP